MTRLGGHEAELRERGREGRGGGRRGGGREVRGENRQKREDEGKAKQVGERLRDGS